MPGRRRSRDGRTRRVLTRGSSAYCARPLRTELRVTGVDMLLSVATLLIYTPHTLYVTCPKRDRFARGVASR